MTLDTSISRKVVFIPQRLVEMEWKLLRLGAGRSSGDSPQPPAAIEGRESKALQ